MKSKKNDEGFEKEKTNVSHPKEKEIMPGVYMTDFRKETNNTIQNNTPKEKLVMPGVYMTDFRKNIPKQTKNTQYLDEKVEKKLTNKLKKTGKLPESQKKTLMTIIARKELIIEKLLLSNSEMEKFDPTKKDKVLQDAIRENIVWILKHHDMIIDCKRKLGIPLTRVKKKQSNEKEKNTNNSKSNSDKLENEGKEKGMYL